MRPPKDAGRTPSPPPDHWGLGRKHLLAGIDAGLRRLVTGGKVRHIGAGNVTGRQLQKAIGLSRAPGWEPFTCLQPLYHLLDRSTEWELPDVCRNEGLGVIPWSPLRGGRLAGAIRRGTDAPAAGSRVATAERMGWSESWSAYAGRGAHRRTLDALHAVAEETGRPAAEVAVNRLLRRPGVTAPLIGARPTEQLTTTLPSSDWELTPAQTARLVEAGAPPRPYPYNVIATDPEDR
ncbi:aldo/keto reductase [Streptomyces sp. B5E4]|uniref:aldo/keto reductase n=1 Tax=Streptomyces sp. B5E4 TaxID=3153568 RepID=UPI00325CED39